MKVLLSLLVIFVSVVGNASALDFPFFERVDKKIYKVVGDTIALSNMPPVRNQSSVGICAGFAAATLIEFSNCQATGKPCGNLTDDEKASAIDLLRFSFDPHKGQDTMRPDYNKGLIEGNLVRFLLLGAFTTERIAKESCAPFTQFTDGIENPDDQVGLWNRYEKLYERTKQLNTQDESQCQAEALKIKNEFNLVGNERDIIRSFGSETYSIFLDRLLVPESCGVRKNALKLQGEWGVGVFPKGDTFSAGQSDKQKQEIIVNEVKRVMTDLGRPVAIGFCADMPFDSKVKCTHGHSVVLKGYRLACKKRAPNDCRPVFQVQNSWGEAWQEEHDDGWVFADELIRRTYYEQFTLAWIKDKTE